MALTVILPSGVSNTGNFSVGSLSTTNGILFNKTTIASNVVFTTGYNASSVGPLTQSSGVSITVSSGSKWIVF
jgi:hypothetical protein